VIVEKVLAAIEANGMLARGDRALVAVSGGPDSVALLDVLARNRRKLGVALHAAHLDHMLRGEEARADAEFCRKHAGKLKVPITVGRANVKLIARKRGLSLEHAARLARYEFLEKTADAAQANRIAVAHNADDQAETVLLNMLRGAGPDGLAGMPAVRGRVIRPLLGVRRREIEAYCAERRLKPRTDLSNLERDFLRNRVRLDLLPALEKEQPKLRQALLRLAKVARDENALLNQMAEDAMAGVCRKATKTRVALGLDAFATLPPALQRRLARVAIGRLRGDLCNIEYVHIETLRALALSGSPGKCVHLPDGLTVTRGYEDLTLSTEPPAKQAPASDEEFALGVPGRTRIAPLGVEIEAEFLPAAAARQAMHEGRQTACLDYARLAEPLTIRTRRPGDRFQPLGMGGTTKLQDFFVDRKVPEPERDRVPLLLSAGEIAWVVGQRIAHPFRLTADTRAALVLRASRGSEQ
jgi:tRNA(Ile)-lysidine synthase